FRRPLTDTDHRSFFVVDSFAGRVVDPVGSGDALLAYATLALLATENIVVAAVLGSFAAAVECEHDGSVPVRTQDVRDKLDAGARWRRRRGWVTAPTWTGWSPCRGRPARPVTPRTTTASSPSCSR